MAKPTRINFYQGKICIKKPDDSLNFQDDSNIPLLKEKIDEYIENNPGVLSGKDIIFGSLTSLFGIDKFFILPNHATYIPSSEPLYNELLHYISENPIYVGRLKKKIELHSIRKEKKREELSKYIQICGYEKEKQKYFAKQEMHSKKR